ncbi:MULTISPECIES: polysaccharide pyruvyl transferase family protein [Chitinophagaceae]
MTELKERIKDFIGNIYFKWIFRRLKPEYTGSKEGNFLLLPPSDLDGSFGDELMVKSFVANFAGSSYVTIFTDHLIRRDDFLGHIPTIKYKNGFQVRNYRRWVDELKAASAVFIIGADALDGTYTTRHSLRFFHLAMMANKMGKPVHFSGFSWSKNATGPAKEALAAVARFSLLKARDTDSFHRLALFVPQEHLLQVSDMAFLCPYNKQVEESNDFQLFKDWVGRQKNANRLIIAVCPNSIQEKKLGKRKYLEDLKSILDAFQSKTDVALLYLYHDVRPLYEETSDWDISKTLYDEQVKLEPGRVFFPEDIQNGIVLKSYLQYVDCTLTGRMHFGISGLEAGKPMFGICYANKFEGMLRLFDVDPNNALVDYTEMNQSGEIIDRFLNDIENQYYKIKNNMQKVREFSLKNGVDIRYSDFLPTKK